VRTFFAAGVPFFCSKGRSKKFKVTRHQKPPNWCISYVNVSLWLVWKQLRMHTDSTLAGVRWANMHRCAATQNCYSRTHRYMAWQRYS